ncbi:hypothetical protein LZ31DRAFT_331877 [Colletotrichum somersetense]|nr:hypothetical protein LZ31DRAFT_331877 [Colletotrichum somersetense]
MCLSVCPPRDRPDRERDRERGREPLPMFTFDLGLAPFRKTLFFSFSPKTYFLFPVFGTERWGLEGFLCFLFLFFLARHQASSITRIDFFFFGSEI